MILLWRVLLLGVVTLDSKTRLDAPATEPCPFVPIATRVSAPDCNWNRTSLRAMAWSTEDSGELVDTYGHRVSRHGRPLDDYSFAAILREVARWFRNQFSRTSLRHRHHHGIHHRRVHCCSACQRACLGKVFRSNWPSPDTHNRVDRIGYRLSNFWFCWITVGVVYLAHRARCGRWYCRRHSGLRGRLNRATRSCSRSRMALGNH